MANPLRKSGSEWGWKTSPGIGLVTDDPPYGIPESPARLLLLRAQMAYPCPSAEPDYGRHWSPLARLLFATGAAGLLWGAILFAIIRLA